MMLPCRLCSVDQVPWLARHVRASAVHEGAARAEHCSRGARGATVSSGQGFLHLVSSFDGGVDTWGLARIHGVLMRRCVQVSVLCLGVVTGLLYPGGDARALLRLRYWDV